MSSGSSSSSTNDSVTDSVTPASDNFQTLTLTSPPSTANPMQYMHFGSFSAHPYPTADFNSYNPAYPTPYQTAHAHAQLAANLYSNGTGNRLSLSQSHQSGLMLGSISRRKRRNLFSPSQISMLEDKFRMNKYLNAADREALAARISLSATQVKIWFQNQRYKHKRQDKERRMDGARCSNSDRDSDTDRDNDSHGSSLVCSPAIKKEEQEDQKPFMSSSVSCLPDIQQHTLPYQVGFRLNGEKKEEPLAPSVSNNELKPYASAATTGADVASCLPDFSQQSFYQMYPPAAYMNPIFTTYPPHPSSYSQASYFTGNQNL